MDKHSPLRGLVSEWACYLKQRGHRIKRATNIPNVLLSRNGTRRRYRWLLLYGEGATRRLTAIEHENIYRHLGVGRKRGEEVYVVVKFERPAGKVVVLPAAKATKAARLRSDKGGIPWNW